MLVWTLEQVDTESRNADAMSTVVGVYATRAACLEAARQQYREDMGYMDPETIAELAEDGFEPDDGETIDLPDDGFEVREPGAPDAVFVYVGTRHDLQQP